VSTRSPRDNSDTGSDPYTDPREPGFSNAVKKSMLMFPTVIILLVIALVVIVVLLLM
jgi:hypothetical protein